jgi:CDP-glucose 4,6-dehydratase
MTSHIGDVRDSDNLARVVKAIEPEIVIHMAAQSLVLDSYADPAATFATNVMGSVHLFDAIRGVDSVRAVVNVTSDKCYENREWAWGYRENEPMGGYDPYSCSKGAAELVTASYRRSFLADAGINLASARAGNVIGGGDWAANRLVPDLNRGLMAGETIIIRNPGAIRPWQHVLEPLSGYLLLAERLCEPGGQALADGWNFGPYESDVQSVEWIADFLCSAWGDGASWRLEGDAGAAPHEAHYLKLDCSKARSELGWRPRLDLKEALQWIVEWTRSYVAGDDMIGITSGQIQRFEALR